MAGGGKETPRQKMVGMMYLVLLAMLALQVSGTVLDKFIFIDKSLEFSNRTIEVDNAKKIESIASVANAKKGKKAIQEVYNDASMIKAKSEEVITFLRQIKAEIVKFGEPDPETGEIKNKSGYDKSMNYTIGAEGTKSGVAYKLKAQLDDYVTFLNEMGNKHIDTTKVFEVIEKIAKDGSEVPEYAESKDPKMKDNAKKDFAYLQFDHTPNVAALAVLSQLESEVLQAESKVLNVLATRVEAKVDFDKVVAVVKPESKYIAAGTEYTATMFIAASSSTARPSMTYNGSKVKVEEGVGEIKFKATAGQYDENGRAKKTWKGSITYSTPFGDTTLQLEEEYFVVKPVIKFESAEVSALYRNCANTLLVDVPALGESYNPAFKVTNAKTTSKGKSLTIIPQATARSVELSVSSNGDLIGKKKFKTKGIPKPDIKLYASGKPVDLAKGIGKTTKDLTVKVIPNAEFAAALPNEAKYRVMKWEVLGAKGPRPVGQPQRVTNGQSRINLGRLAREAGRLVVEIKAVVRKNSLGKMEEVKGVNQVVNIPITK